MPTKTRVWREVLTRFAIAMRGGHDRVAVSQWELENGFDGSAEALLATPGLSRWKFADETYAWGCRELVFACSPVRQAVEAESESRIGRA